MDPTEEFNLRNGAANMYDGGWRSTDRADLFTEYEGMTDEKADVIVDELRRIEERVAEEEEE